MNASETGVGPKIGILRYDGKPNPDLPLWKKSFATAMSQIYGEPALLFKTGKTYAYDAPEPLSQEVMESVSVASEIEKTHYLEQLSEHKKVLQRQKTIHFKMYMALYERLHEDTVKKLSESPLWNDIDEKHDPKGLMEELTRVQMMCSTGNIRQDRHKTRMAYNSLQQHEKESLMDYYIRTQRVISNQVAVGQTPDKEEDQAIDFIYKLDRKTFQDLISKMDWEEASEIRKHQDALKEDQEAIFKSAYPNTLNDAYQRAKAYLAGQARPTTGVMTTAQHTVFASETSD